MSDLKYLFGGMVAGMFIAAYSTGGVEAASQCLMPFIAMSMIMGMFLMVGMLIDPKGTESMVKDSAEYWKNHLTED